MMFYCPAVTRVVSEVFWRIFKCLSLDWCRSCCSLGLHCECLVRLNLSSCPLLSDQGLI